MKTILKRVFVDVFATFFGMYVFYLGYCVYDDHIKERKVDAIEINCKKTIEQKKG